MRWTTEDKLEFIKQFKKDGTVRRVDGCAPHTIRCHVKKWIKAYDAFGIIGITHTKNKSFSYKDKLKAIDLINQGLTYSEIALKFKAKD